MTAAVTAARTDPGEDTGLDVLVAFAADAVGQLPDQQRDQEGAYKLGGGGG